MAIFVGSLREVTATKESTRGTAIAPVSGAFLRHYGHSIVPVATKIDHEGADGTIGQIHASHIVAEGTAGNIPFMLERENAWLVANAICGQNPVTTGSAPYTHAYTFDADNNVHQSFTLNFTDPVTGDQAAPLGMLNSLSLSVAPDNYVQAESAWEAGKSASATYTPSYVASPSFYTPSQVAIKIAANYAGLGAASATEVSNWAVTITKNLARIPVAGSTESYEIVNQRTDIRGEITLPYDATTLRALALGNDTRALQLTLSDGTYSFTLELPTVNFRDWTDGSDNNAYVPNTIMFVATNADTTNGLIKCTVIDATATH